MPGALTILPFGPFSKGVLDSGNPSTDLRSAARVARGLYFSGAQRLGARGGSQLAMTLFDDAGSPALVTSVRHVGPFSDRAIAIAHSTVTSKAYLYVLTAALDGWYNSAGVLQANLNAQPAGVLWTAITTAPDVFATEGLGTLYVAHAQAQDASGLFFPTKQWDGTYPVTIANYLVNGTGGTAGTDAAYFLGVIAFQEHLWGWGYGTGNTTPNAYRPEIAKYSQPNFAPPQSSDSITLGDRVRSQREKIIGAGLAGEAMILCGSFMLSRVTGQGRASWYKQRLDGSHGITGPKAGVSDGTYFYFWSSRGPMRVAERGAPEPLWGGVANLVKRVVNAQKIVASRLEAEDCIVFTVDVGSGVRTRAAFDVVREVWLGPDDDMGILIAAGGEVDPVTSSVAAGVAPPSGPPTTPSTTSVGVSTAQANWVNGDPGAATQVEIRVQGTTAWTVVTSVAAGVTSYIFTGLTFPGSYEWRAAHVRGGQLSAYLGPVPGTQFATTDQLQPPTNLALSEVSVNLIHVTWTNSGESGVSTEIYAQSPGVTGYVLKYTAVPGQSSQDIGVSAGAGAYQVEIRHVKSGVTSSNYQGPNTINLT